jgi:hypothetical protein
MKKSYEAKKVQRMLVFSLIVILMAFLGACQANGTTGELQTDNETVQLGDARIVDTQITVGAGDLTITGGADNLLDATFTYNIPSSKPEVNYDVNQSGDTNIGNLTVKQPAELDLSPNLTDYRYDWDLKFDNSVPMSMEIKLGAGETNLNLGELNLTGLDVTVGAGTATVDLTGEYQSDLQAEIRGGVGNLNLILPESTGVRVKIDGGLGNVVATGLQREGDDFVNETYGSSEHTLEVHVQGGVGEINMEVSR